MTWKFTSASGNLKSGTSVFDLPLGTILPYSAAQAPAGWLACDGSAVSRTEFKDLFDLVGTTYGAGDGTTTFNVPDMRGRVPMGAGTGAGEGASGLGKPAGTALTARTLGAWGGAELHTLTAAQIPAHGHALTGGINAAATGVTTVAHSHPQAGFNGGTGGVGQSSVQLVGNAAQWLLAARSDENVGNLISDPTHAHGHTLAVSNSTGGGSGHANTQPFVVVTYIVKAHIQKGTSAGGTTSAIGASVPVGGEVVYYGAAEPADGNWRFPHGQEVLIADYPDAYNLFTSNGTNFPFGANTNGAGAAGNSHFRLPDARGLVAVTKDNGKGRLTGLDNIGAVAGAQTVALMASETPLKAHTHSGTTGNDNTEHTHSGTTGTVSSDHTHNPNHNAYSESNTPHDWNFGDTATARRSFKVYGSMTMGGITANHTHGFTTGGRSAVHQHQFTTGNPNIAEANGAAHENMQPHMRVNKLIRMR